MYEAEEKNSKGEQSESAQWKMVSAHSMLETTSMISVGNFDHKEFSFVVKPCPGSRMTDLVSFGMIPEI